MKTLQDIFSNNKETCYRLCTVNGLETYIFTSFWGAMNHARIPGYNTQLACCEEPADITSWAADVMGVTGYCWLEDANGLEVEQSDVEL